MYWLTVSVGQKSEYSLVASSGSRSHKAVIKVLSGTVVISELGLGRSRPEAQSLGCGQTLGPHWQLARHMRFLPAGPLHRDTHNKIPDSSQSKGVGVKEKERAPKMEACLFVT